jgi:hypothetical protein
MRRKTKCASYSDGIAYVPLLGLFAPVIFGLAFIHHLLGALARLRAVPIEGEVARDRARISGVPK